MNLRQLANLGEIRGLNLIGPKKHLKQGYVGFDCRLLHTFDILDLIFRLQWSWLPLA